LELAVERRERDREKNMREVKMSLGARDVTVNSQ
jgi:hypothetical protein